MTAHKTTIVSSGANGAKWVKPPPLPGVPFEPHAFRTRITPLRGEPRIFINPEVYDTMYHIVDLAEGEVGWLGTVKVLPSGAYLIEEIFLLQQEVSMVTTDLSKKGKSELIKELISKGGDEKLDRLYFWGHSHVDFGTTPSPKDEAQFRKFEDDGCPYMIMGIFNKLGRAEFTFFDFEAGVRIDDVRWSIYKDVSDDRRDAIKAEMAEKLTEADVVDYAGTGEDQPPYLSVSPAFNFQTDVSNVVYVYEKGGGDDNPGHTTV